MSRRGSATLALAAALIWPAAARAAATFTIQNLDPPGQGFNDTTPATPVGGNTGTTIGQQRMNAFKQATAIWGAMIDSAVPIVIAANFQPLACDANSITLGQAATSGVEIDEPGSPPNLLVPEALADKLAGFDINPGLEDIDAQFNGALGQCSGGTEDWYYGFDGKPPADDLDLLSVLLHELGHGLGFVSFVDNNTGALYGGFVDVFSAHLYDNQTNMLWSAMTDAQRATSVQNVRHLVWQGDNVSKMAPMVLAKGAPRITPGATISGFSGALSEATFGPLLSAGQVQGTVVVGNPADGCTATPPSYQGKIVLFQGGDCPSIQKSNLAEGTGALAILITDPVGVAPPSSIEVPPSQQAQFSVAIPVIGVTDGDGALLSSGGKTVLLDADSTRMVGADAQGRMYMYASNPIVMGSTVSHWDVLARPNLMEEPNASYIISHDIRMEAALLRDIGWTSSCGNGQIDPPEQCDNGAANSDTTPDACRTTCVKASCGDGVIDTGEQCDNGLQNGPGAACDAQCHTSTATGKGGGGGTSSGGASGHGGSAGSAGSAGASGQGGSAGSSGQGGSGGATGQGGGGATGQGGAAGATGQGGSAGATGTGGSSQGGATGGGTGGTSGSSGGGGGGCSCQIGDGGQPGATLVLLVGLGLAALRRRRVGRA
jgi:MYXO-CTERM domain-containing protein